MWLWMWSWLWLLIMGSANVEARGVESAKVVGADISGGRQRQMRTAETEAESGQKGQKKKKAR